MNDINDWKRCYGEERVKRAELEVATDELVEAAEMVLACLDQPRSRDNSEHAGLDAAEALRKATAEVKEFNSATLQYVHGLAAGDLPMVGDLAMLVARLARKLRKATPADELPAQALDYLNRNGLKGSPLRKVGTDGTATVTREMIGAAHDVMLSALEVSDLQQLVKRLASAEQDAARYRWLRENRDNGRQDNDMITYTVEIATSTSWAGYTFCDELMPSFDEAVDAAMKEEAK